MCHVLTNMAGASPRGLHALLGRLAALHTAADYDLFHCNCNTFVGEVIRLNPNPHANPHPSPHPHPDLFHCNCNTFVGEVSLNPNPKPDLILTLTCSTATATRL